MEKKGEALQQEFDDGSASTEKRHQFPYWMVWGAARYPPKKWHQTEAIAIAEAERLAVLKPDVRFYVFRVITSRKMKAKDDDGERITDGVERERAEVGSVHKVNRDS